jgi:hypothetical protein
LRVNVSSGEPGLLGYQAKLMSGDSGTEQTVRLMRKLIDQALSDPSFVRFAIDLVRHVPAHDDAGEVAAIFNWVKSNIRYTKDPVTKEKLYPPQELLKIRAGDCDDMSMLLGALAIACGYPARLVTVSVDPDFPNDFSHVYCEVEVPPGSQRWVALDAARPGAAFGRAPEHFFRKRAWSLTENVYTDLNGLQRYATLNGYARLHGLGQDLDAVVSQALTETPAIMAAAQGMSTTVLPNGTVVTSSSPYASFATPYTPGYASPAAGYPAGTSVLSPLSSSLFSGSMVPLLLIGVLAIAMMKK